MKICIIATENYLYDTRMYWKEAMSLRNKGYNVTCIVMSEDGVEEQGVTDEGIKYFKFINKIQPYVCKMFSDIYSKYTFTKNTFKTILEFALSEKYNVYHLNGLYSLFMVNAIKKHTNSKIIYESREFYPDAIRDYNITCGFKSIEKNVYSYYMDLWEVYNAGKCDCIITTDKFINDRFKLKCSNKNIHIVYNFTDIKPIDKVNWSEKVYDMIYCGGVTKVRGIMQLLQCVNIGRKYKKNIKLLIIGPTEPSLKCEMNAFINDNNLQNNVEVLGRIDFKEVTKYLEKSKIGMVTLLPIPKYKKNVPMKQFEYMAYGLPIVGSKLPPIEEFTGKSEVGILVNPLNPEEIWEAVYTILNDNDIYKRFSDNGIDAVSRKFNWDISEKELIDIYNKLL
ncbi:glycosyltransferase family 4 protein [Clostridium neuense]|uniref:Glycosyltransferase family 4 protein n=1 Tax=Clostridium neuense TaxID=1728934 RepID=A0ABW8TJH9_9CLOT